MVVRVSRGAVSVHELLILWEAQYLTRYYMTSKALVRTTARPSFYALVLKQYYVLVNLLDQ